MGHVKFVSRQNIISACCRRIAARQYHHLSLLETLIANILNSLYHYTTEYGQLAIIESGVLRPSVIKPNGRDVLLGEGQYLTSIAPETIACRSRTEMTFSQQQAGKLSLFQLSRHILGGSLSLKKLDYFIEVDVSNLIIRHSIEHEYIYLHESNIDLDISNRIIRWGKTLA